MTKHAQAMAEQIIKIMQTMPGSPDDKTTAIMAAYLAWRSL